ncbi:MAG: EAL domain-containing protein [Paucibacter sp.]|nr:EAL domain-containing protein [Roseateles sp.]
MEKAKLRMEVEAFERDLRQRRLRQLNSVLGLGFGVTALIAAAGQDWRNFGMVTASLLALIVAGALRRRGRTGPASAVTLAAVCVAVFYGMWMHQGVYSPAMLVLPLILLVAHVLIGARASLVLTLVVGAGLVAMAWIGMAGLHEFRMTPVTWTFVGYEMVFVGAFAGVARLVSRDQRDGIERLVVEVERVRASEAKLAHLADHDVLTGLPNRRLCMQLGEKALAASRRQGSVFALLFINIDRFRAVNDSFGHAAGDELLCWIARRLGDIVREADIVARHGGDEFVVLMGQLHTPEEVASAASRVLHSLSENADVAGVSVPMSASIGVAVYPSEGSEFETLLRHAATAAQHAKDAGRNVIRYFSDEMNANMVEDLNLQAEFRPALLRGDFRLHYQPVIELPTGRVIGAECLLRWVHPERGLIPPVRFVPLAERSGFIVDLGTWVIERAVAQLATWSGTPLGDIVLSVNVSTIQFRRGTLDAVVAAALDRHGVRAGRLKLEVTESALVHDAERFVAMLQVLKSLGVGLAIDDFGTGYSNLAYLQRFEVDELKIDQVFVRRLAENAQDRAIVQAVIQMAHSLGLNVTAEGIEDEATRLELLRLGCDSGQGFYFARPCELDAFERLVSAALPA